MKTSYNQVDSIMFYGEKNNNKKTESFSTETHREFHSDV